MLSTLFAGAAGAALAYFLDPDMGKRRRNMTRDRVAAFFRGGAVSAERAGRAAAAEAYGMTQKATHLMSEEEPPANDATLARKVESELFRDPDIPKGRININVEHGRVVLRGELDHPEQISAIEETVRKIPGVLEVENLLHLPGTPAGMC
jgi:hypothetical protein